MFDLSFFEKLHAGGRRYFSVAFFLVAFVASLMPVRSLQNHFLLTAIVALGGIILFQLCDRRPRSVPRFGERSIFVIFGGLCVLALSSIVFSDIPYSATLYGGVFFLMPMSFFIVSHMNDPNFTRRIFIGVAVIYVFLSLTTLLQYYFVTPYLEDGRINWPLQNPNILAGLFSFGFIGALALAVRYNRFWYAMFAVVVFAGILMTGGRGALYATVGSSAVMLLCLKDLARHRLPILLGIAVSCVTIFLLLSFEIHTAAQSPSESFGLSNAYLSERWEMWKSAFEIFKDFPLTGTGIGTFLFYYQEYRLEDYGSAGYMAHNDVLQFATEMGILAPVLIYGLAAAIVVITWQSLRGLAADHAARIPLTASFFALLCCFAQTHISFHFHTPSTMVMTGIALGVWLNAVRGIAVTSETYALPDYARMGAAFTLILLLTFFASQVAGHIYLGDAQNALRQKNERAFLASARAADAVSGGKNGSILAVKANHILNSLSSDPALSRKDREQRLKDVGILLDRAISVDSRLASTYHLHAKYLLLSGQNGAELSLRKALRINPELLVARIDLAKFYERNGNKNAALLVLKNGLKRKHSKMSALPYYVYLTKLAKDLDDYETMHTGINLANSFHERVRVNMKKRQGLKNLLSKVWIK